MLGNRMFDSKRGNAMPGDYLQYIISNVVCAFIFGIMLVHDLVSVDRQEKQIRFDRALIPFMVYFVLDALWAAMEGGMIPRNMVSFAILNFALAVALSLITYMWLRFVLAMEKAPGREKLGFRLIMGIPLYVAALGLIIFFFAARPLIVDENYVLQPLYFVFMNGPSYLYLAAILIYTISRAVKEQSRGDRRSHLMVGLLPSMVVIGGILQTFWPSIAIFCFACTFLMLIFYIQSMQGRISLDPLTKVNNRGQLMHYMSQETLIHRERKMTYLIIIDVNDFKKINDTYGHAEGDRALVILASALKKVVNEKKAPMFLGRYGGDEFMIIAHPESEEEVKDIVSSVRASAEEKCAEEQTPYILSLAVGYDRLGEGQDNFESCFERADHNLYLDKEHMKAHRLNRPGKNGNKPRA